MTRLRSFLGLVVVLNVAACAPPNAGPGLACGEGTVARDGACVSTITCAAGTHAVAGTCVADPQCTAGTHELDGGCVADVRCAEGTHAVDGQCVADPVTIITCGAGTHLVEAECVVDAPPEPPVSPWSPAQRVCEAGTPCSEPVLVRTTHGALIAVAENPPGKATVGVYRQTADGFVLARRFEGQSDVALFPSMVSRGPTIYLAYTDYTPSRTSSYGPGDLMLARSDDEGLTWTAPTRINATPATTLLYTPRLAVSATGLDVLYVDTDGVSTSDNRWLHSDDGLTFGAPIDLPSLSTFDRLTLTGTPAWIDGVLEVPTQRSGYDRQTYDPLSALEVLSVTPATEQTPLVTHSEQVRRVFSTSDLEVDPTPSFSSANGVRCLAFVDAPSRDYGLFVVRTEGPITAGQRAHLLPGGPGSVQLSPGVAVDPDGNCSLAWLDNRSGQWEVFSATYRADGSWTEPVKVTPDGFAEDGITRVLEARVVLAHDASGRAAVWATLENGQSSVSFATAP